MTPWVKWTIAGFFAFLTFGSLYTTATSDQGGEFRRGANEAQRGLDEYERSLCNAGNQAACERLKR